MGHPLRGTPLTLVSAPTPATKAAFRGSIHQGGRDSGCNLDSSIVNDVSPRGKHLTLPHKVDNVVTIAGDKPFVSGVAWPESIARVKGSVYLASEPYSEGQVITFADEPHFRLNAALYSPSFPR